MKQLFCVGDRIGNYCNGFFGRDDYENKTCMLVTDQYAVFQDHKGYGSILNFSENLAAYANGENCKWNEGEYDEEY